MADSGQLVQRVSASFAMRMSVGLRLYAQFARTFGAVKAVRLVMIQLLAPSRLLMVKPRRGPELWARVGRRESDLRVLVDVWGNDSYAAVPLRDPEWIIDAGANVGYVTAWFALKYPNAQVIAVEPSNSSVDLLRKNTVGMQNVRVLECALGASEGVAEIVDVGEGPWALRVGAAAGQQGQVIAQVPVRTVLSVLQEFGLSHLDLLKIDIEGGEVEVFESSAEWIGSVEVITAELHDRFRPGCSRAFIRATEDFEDVQMSGESHVVRRAREA